MATLALAAAGAAVGGAIGGPAGAQIGFAAGTILGSILFPPDPIEGARLSDLKVSGSTYGRPWPICYGTMRVGSNMIWGQNIKERDREQGGKGGASTIEYSYFGNFAMAFTEGPVEAITRVWADGKLILDLTGATPVIDDALLAGGGKDFHTTIIADIQEGVLDEAQLSGINLGRARLYLGTESQLPDPWIQADKGLDNTPAYRGLSYIVFQDLPLEDFGNRYPQITAEIACNAAVSYPTSSLSPGYNTQAIRWHPALQHLYAFQAGPQVFRIDALSQKVITVGSLDDGTWQVNDALFEFNSSGDFYAWTLVVGGQTRLSRLDGDTFAFLAQTGSGISGSGEFSATIVGDATVTPSGQLVVIETSIVSNGDIGVWDGIKTDGINAQSSSGMRLYAVTSDLEGRVWVLATGSGESPTGATILQVDPHAASIINRYEITGYDSVDQSAMFYDAATDALYWMDTALVLVRFRLDTFTVDATLDLAQAGGGNLGAMRNGSFAGRIWVQDASNTFTEIDLLSMTNLRTVTNTAGTWNAGTVSQPIYSPRQHALIVNNTSTHLLWLYLDRATPAKVPLSDIVDDISDRVNIGSAERSTSALTDQVYGYFLSSRMSGRQALEPLGTAYFFDARESDWVAEFVKRGGAVAATIPQDDLGAVATPDASGQTPELEETRGQELELPERVDVTYSDASVDHETMTQHAKRAREAIKTRDLVEVGLPLAFEDEVEPAQIAEKILYAAWAERTRYGAALTWEHLRVDPADLIDVTRGSNTFRMRVLQTDWGADGVLQLRGVNEETSVYTSFAAGTPALGHPAQTIEQTGPSALQLMDMPLARDVDEGLLFYVGAGGWGSGGWPGAQVYRSTDNVDFSDGLLFVPSGRNMIHGSAPTVLASGTTTVWDTANSVTVRLVRGSLASSTRIGVLNHANPILIGDEIVQFVTAVDNGDDTWTLSELLRGRRGTEWAVGTHAVNERVVLLTDTTVMRAVVGSDELTKTRHYKAVTVGGSINLTTSKPLTFAGRSKMPLSPVHINATEAAATWTIFWTRRTRVGGAWLDGVDVPLSEASEDYEVDILNGATVVRTITTTASAGGSVVTAASSQATYTAADIATDLGSPTPISLSVQIYQLSATVGRGFSGDDATLQAA